MVPLVDLDDIPVSVGSDGKNMTGPSSGVFPESFKRPKFDDPYKARDYFKGRLALAFRIFAKHGFDEGVAGHITLRVWHLLRVYLKHR